jgi:acetyl esterase
MPMSFDQTLRQFRDRLHLPEKLERDLKAQAKSLGQKVILASRAIEPDVPDMAAVNPVLIPAPGRTIRARHYVPLGAGVPPGPGIVFFHGGGFTLGDLESHDVLCRRLAESARCRVLAVDYRRAPQHIFPAAHDDALAAWAFAVAEAKTLGMDTARLAVAGDSAGGNLAAYIAQNALRTGTAAPAFQLLLYPLVQFTDLRGRKLRFQEGGFLISNTIFEFYRNGYLKNAADQMDLRVSPLFADAGSFQGLAPAHVVLAGWDPLHDEGRLYAEKMQSYGVPVSVREHADMVHGFMNFTALSTTARAAIRDAGRITGKALGAL